MINNNKVNKQMNNFSDFHTAQQVSSSFNLPLKIL